jgi:hypothetical protein
LKLNIPDLSGCGWGQLPITASSWFSGNRAFFHRYKDGATEIDFYYTIVNGTTSLLRKMVIE